MARLERYLVLSREVGVDAVVILRKTDLTDPPDGFVEAARVLKPGLALETVDAHDASDFAGLSAWCGPGQAVAFLGSAGGGKSTLVNTLCGSDRIAMQAVRASDDTVSHTTIVREMHRLAHGGWPLDLAGMREW